jgi:hypothetical protein
MSQISLQAPLQVPFLQGVKHAVGRTPRRLRLLLAVVMLIAAAYEVSLALQTPAQSIRDALTAAGEEAARLPSTRKTHDVGLTLARHFVGQDARIEPSRFPAEVAVVLEGLDRATCLEARMLARRIEGDVVIALDGYGSATDCQEHNRMTWHILP